MCNRLCQALSVLIVCVTLVVSMILLVNTRRNWPGADELVFTRMTARLPSYATHAEWWTLNGDQHPFDWLVENNLIPDAPGEDPETFAELRSAPGEVGEIYHIRNKWFYDAAYEIPVWYHPPLASYLSWPFVVTLFNENDVANSFSWLRLAAWCILAICVILIYKIVKTYTADKPRWLLLSMLVMLPVLVYFTFYGNNWFYPDIYMVLFLTLSLYLRQKGHVGWMYVTLAAMTICKTYGFVFLIPFIFENKKTTLCILALVPYWIYAWIVSNDPLYLWHFWKQFSLMPDTSSVFVATIKAWWARLSSGIELARVYIAVMVAPLMYYAVKLFKRDVGIVPLLLFFAVTAVALTWGPNAYHMLPFIVVGPFLISQLALKRRRLESSIS